MNTCYKVCIETSDAEGKSINCETLLDVYLNRDIAVQAALDLLRQCCDGAEAGDTPEFYADCWDGTRVRVGLVPVKVL